MPQICTLCGRFLHSVITECDPSENSRLDFKLGQVGESADSQMSSQRSITVKSAVNDIHGGRISDRYFQIIVTSRLPRMPSRLRDKYLGTEKWWSRYSQGVDGDIGPA